MEFKAAQWIGWIGATVVAALTMASYTFSNFETVNHAREFKNDVQHRLERIEGKLDQLVSR